MACTVPAAVAALKEEAGPEARALWALPARPKLAALCLFLHRTPSARALLFESERVADHYKAKLGKRLAMHDTGRAAAALAALLPAKDHAEGAALKALKALPPPSGSESVAGLFDTFTYSPLTEPDVRAALEAVHGPSPEVDEFLLAAGRAASPAHSSAGIHWDLAWALYARAASPHLPPLTGRQVSPRAQRELSALPPSAFLGDDEDDEPGPLADRMAALSV